MAHKPFHESILLLIASAEIIDLNQLILAIKTTVIPRDHDKIIEAWKNRIHHLGLTYDYGVVADILSQKRQTENED